MIKSALAMGALLLAMGQPLAAYGTKSHKLILDLEGLEPMKGQHFEGWNIVKGEAISTGRFSLAKNGDVYAVNSKGKAIKKIGEDNRGVFKLDKKAVNASTFVLTIEPNGDQDAGPSDVHVLGGDFTGGKSDLRVDHGSSLQTDFATASGGFIMAAPTGGEFNQGVWFVDPSKGESSLELPTLPKGWAYEGWIVNTKNQALLSTGLFFEGNGADSDGAGLFAGALKLSFPPVAGQDIVKTPIVLDDGIHAIVVSVEPYPDYDPAPFAIKPLMGKIEAGSAGMTLLGMDNISEMTVPKGSALIK
jgi:hypothetical protein